MAYSKDARELVFKYLAEGHTYEEAREARKELGVSASAIKSWKKLLNVTGSLEIRPRERLATKFPDEELKDYIKENPDAMLLYIRLLSKPGVDG